MTITRRGLLAAPALLAVPARAQAWPDRPVRILVPYTPGAFNDTLARLVGERMGEALGQIGVVENRPGASGSLAIAATAQATDHHTIAIANTANLTMNPFLFSNTGYDPVKDIAPLCVTARLMNCLAVRTESGIGSLAELIERAKSQPGRMSFASSGAGSSPHLAAELFRARAGLELVHVPYRGSAPGVADLIGGRVDMTVDNLPNVLPNIQGGRLRALAVTGSERDPALPDVPTFAEAGLPGYEVYVWFGFIGSASMPQAVRDRLSAAISGIVQAAETAEKIRRAGATVWVQDQQQMAALIRSDLEKWGGVIRAANLRIE
ncbi:Bug family tripartite tricarboxylate transporter substrate binding protein [Belnapia rosea]|uniref:Tripartite-type tricarboxylate transporter, receptor component TctC n=1 Tax=Belnapia rosea TaxID=938405 RepID=A0A1G6LS82_9PROT|nr:tripartite tricarboxylate transporter substrate binding protein [Belnapia rosea]SDB46272.1 Tripartite-type tricarboxylate transporter, receptor component TctC [Belnapia rosea]SDC46122.1 Tripartite-type tricarboxylate transporter, receptor component TctC [Belnapia rosea]